MAAKNNVIIGALLIVILAASIAVTMNDVRIKATAASTTFYVFQNGVWLTGGVESNTLYNGSKSISRGVTTLNSLPSGGEYKIIRTATYGKATVIDTYLFDGTTTDKELFPIYHTIQILNGQGLTYQYTANNLQYSGPNLKNVPSPQTFGRSMKIYYQDGWTSNTLSKLTSGGSLKVKYAVTSNNQVFNIRMFDPLVAPQWSNNQSSYPATYSPSTASTFNITWVNGTVNSLDTVLIEGNWSGTATNYTYDTKTAINTTNTYNSTATSNTGWTNAGKNYDGQPPYPGNTITGSILYNNTIGYVNYTFITNNASSIIWHYNLTYKITGGSYWTNHFYVDCYDGISLISKYYQGNEGWSGGENLSGSVSLNTCYNTTGENKIIIKYYNDNQCDTNGKANCTTNVWDEYITFNNYTTTITGPPNVTVNYSNTLPAGHWYWKSYANDSSGSWNATPSWFFDIGQLPNPLTLVLNNSGNMSCTYPCVSNASGNGNLTVANLYRNAILKNGENKAAVQLAAGTHVYIFNTSGNQNYTTNSTSLWLTINQATPSLSLFVNGTSGDQTRDNGILNITAALDAVKSLLLYRNGTLLQTSTTPLINISNWGTTGLFNVTAWFAGDENYTSAISSLNLRIDVINASISLPPSTKFRINATSNTGNFTPFNQTSFYNSTTTSYGLSGYSVTQIHNQYDIYNARQVAQNLSGSANMSYVTKVTVWLKPWNSNPALSTQNVVLRLIRNTSAEPPTDSMECVYSANEICMIFNLTSNTTVGNVSTSTFTPSWGNDGDWLNWTLDAPWSVSNAATIWLYVSAPNLTTYEGTGFTLYTRYPNVETYTNGTLWQNSSGAWGQLSDADLTAQIFSDNSYYPPYDMSIPIFNVTNTGTTAINVSMRLNASLPSCMATSLVSTNRTFEWGVDYNVTGTSWVQVISNLGVGQSQGIWTQVEYNSCPVGTTYVFNRQWNVTRAV